MKDAYRNAEPTENLSAAALKDEIRREFARRLQAAMSEKDWNQSDLARQAQIGRDNVSNYIRGANLPGPARMRRLADALGVSKEWLLPTAISPSVDKEAPPLAMRAASDGTAWLQVNQWVDVDTAVQIIQLLQKKRHQPSA